MAREIVPSQLPEGRGASQDDHSGAAEQASEAAALASRDGERPGAWELFGPANVGVWRTSLAVEAGQAESSLTYADQVQPRDLAAVGSAVLRPAGPHGDEHPSPARGHVRSAGR